MLHFLKFTYSYLTLQKNHTKMKKIVLSAAALLVMGSAIAQDKMAPAKETKKTTTKTATKTDAAGDKKTTTSTETKTATKDANGKKHKSAKKTQTTTETKAK